MTGTGHCFAFLICATFDACYSVGSGGVSATGQIWVSKSHWAVMGFEVQNPSTSGTDACFKASPLSAASITDVAFIDDIANGCGLGGFVTAPYYVGGPYGVDYFVLISDIAYNTAQSSAQCASGVSVWEPVNYDTLPGTHTYIAQNFIWGNVDPNPCAGTTPTDGEGIILDTFNAFSYTGQVAIENTIDIWNGSSGLEAFLTGTAPIYMKHNTLFANSSANARDEAFCGEFLIDNAANTQTTGNIARTNAATSCNSWPNYAYYVYTGNSSTINYQNFVYSAAGHNSTCDGTCTGYTFGPNNTTGTDPAFASAPASTPAAPSCGSYSSVVACMAPLVAEMTPTAAGTANYGYQPPSSTPNSDPLFPRWLCQYSNQSDGLVTMGCAAQ